MNVKIKPINDLPEGLSGEDLNIVDKILRDLNQPDSYIGSPDGSLFVDANEDEAAYLIGLGIAEPSKMPLQPSTYDN